MIKPLFFIHIPKTAGTSLRTSIEEYYQGLGLPNGVLRDYGADSPATSEEVIESVYKCDDAYALVADASPCHVLTGHVRVAKYQRIFGTAQIFTVVREPIARLISEYRHFQRHFDYPHSFRKFAQRKGKQNMLASYMNGVPWQAYGYVGLSEQFEQSLEAINSIYGLSLKYVVANEAPAEQVIEITEDDLKYAREVNKTDIVLYERVKNYHLQRQQMRKQGLPFVQSRLTFFPEKSLIQGFAFWESSLERDDSVALKIEVRDPNGAIYSTDQLANHYNAKWAHVGMPRAGYVDVVCRLSDVLPADSDAQLPTTHAAFRKAGWQLCVRVQETQQELLVI